MAMTTVEKVLVGSGVVAGVLIVGFGIAKASTKNVGPVLALLTPQNSGGTFVVQVGQWVKLAVPVDPTGTVTYDTSATYDPPAGMFSSTAPGTYENKTGFYAQIAGPGQWTVSANVLTNGTVTGQLQWTITVGTAAYTDANGWTAIASSSAPPDAVSAATTAMSNGQFTYGAAGMASGAPPNGPVNVQTNYTYGPFFAYPNSTTTVGVWYVAVGSGGTVNQWYSHP